MRKHFSTVPDMTFGTVDAPLHPITGGAESRNTRASNQSSGIVPPT